MGRGFLLLMSILPLSVFAQNVWEMPDANEAGNVEMKENKQSVKVGEDAKYLEGAVSEVNGKVEWILDMDVPGKDASRIYDIMLKYFTSLTKAENQLEGSCVPIVNRQDHIVVATVKEWLVFKENFLTLDRAKFNYTLVAYCSDNHLKLSMSRLYYVYDEGQMKNCPYKAEEWINDENALNRKKTKLLRGSAKFRRKTVDRKEQVFDLIRTTVLK